MDEFIVKRTSSDFKDKGLSEYEAFINCSIDDVISNKKCDGHLYIAEAKEGGDPLFITHNHDGGASFQLRIVNTYDRMDIEDKYEVEYYSPEDDGLEELWELSKPLDEEMVYDLLNKYGYQDYEEDDYDM